MKSYIPGKDRTWFMVMTSDIWEELTISTLLSKIVCSHLQVKHKSRLIRNIPRRRNRYIAKYHFGHLLMYMYMYMYRECHVFSDKRCFERHGQTITNNVAYNPCWLIMRSSNTSEPVFVSSIILCQVSKRLSFVARLSRSTTWVN